MYGAGRAPCGKSQVNCQVLPSLVLPSLVLRHQQLNCRLVSGLEPPRTIRRLTKPCKSDFDSATHRFVLASSAIRCRCWLEKPLIVLTTPRPLGGSVNGKRL